MPSNMAIKQMIAVQHTTVSSANTPTTSSYTILYYGYLKTPSGFLKLGQLLCCIAMVTLLAIGHNDYNQKLLDEMNHLFFFTMGVTFLILTFCILLSYTLSVSSYNLLGRKSHFEVIFNIIGFLLFLTSTIIYFIYLNDHNFSRSQYNMFSIAGYCGGTLAVLYSINAIIVR